jgi:cytochrome b subunit of formate dehydrogenase
VGQSYVAAVAFVAMLTLLVTGIVIAYLIVALIGPGVFGSFGGRTATFRYLIVAAYLALVALAVLQTHRNLLHPGLRLFPKGRHTGTPPPPPPATESPSIPLT